MDLQQKSNKPKSVIDEIDAGTIGVQVTGSGADHQSTPAVGISAAFVEPNILGEPSALNDLVKLLLLKEGREARKEQLDLDRQVARQSQRDRNAREIDSKVLLKQARCRHLKGGKNRSKVQKIDYAVYPFTFSDADTYVRCQICGMKWRKNDTKEFLSRADKKGKIHKIANHTKIGWHEAMEMVEMSSNTAGSSEIPGRVLSGELGANASVGTQIGRDGIPYTPRVVDLEGNSVSDFEL
jgi:hypothetical protein